jgi:hypothetical protein
MVEYINKYCIVFLVMVAQSALPLAAAESIWYRKPEIIQIRDGTGTRLTVSGKDGILKKTACPRPNHKYKLVEYSVAFGGFGDFKRFPTQQQLLAYLCSIDISIETYPWDNANYFDTSDTGSNCFIFQLFGPARDQGGGPF